MQLTSEVDGFEFFMRNYTDHDIHEIIYCFDSMILMVVGCLRTAFLKKKMEAEGNSMMRRTQKVN